jgi:NAD(P)-dependent dehydrogenase (short-subunit alcohol dehydrogenase family)
MSEIRFDEQVAIVTGAGHGLGRTYAAELARRGAAVVVNDLGVDVHGQGSGPAAQVVVDEITEAGGRAVANMDSVATVEGGQAIVDAAIENFGRVDIVINNAGILRDKSFHNLSFAEMDDILNVHLRGAFFVSQPAYKIMREQKYGRFLFTSSAAGLFGNFGQTNYSAAKMGLVGLSNTIAIEGAKSGIQSNAIAPIARTRMTEELLGPMADLLHPEFVTPLALYLCSRDCTLTHEVFSVGAGRYARAFVGVSDGWFAGKGNVPTTEEVAEHLAQIRDLTNYVIPDNANGEIALLGPLLT